jgi:antitoxin component YwqK of YwqJK toxin-antitoxin module
VKYPSGVIHYRGEYKNDQTVGVWTTYDEKGKVINETDFGYPQN